MRRPAGLDGRDDGRKARLELPLSIRRFVEEHDSRNVVEAALNATGRVLREYEHVVGPANYTFKKNGKPVKEVGSMFTLTLQKGQTGWRITGWAWAKH